MFLSILLFTLFSINITIDCVLYISQAVHSLEECFVVVTTSPIHSIIIKLLYCPTNCTFVYFLQAILRQWEMEQCQDVITSNGNTNWMTSGFALACAKAMESQRPRSRGCLKHVSVSVSLLSSY